MPVGSKVKPKYINPYEDNRVIEKSWGKRNIKDETDMMFFKPAYYNIANGKWKES